MIGSYFHGKLQGQDHSWMGYKEYKEFSPEVKWSVWQRSLYGFGSFLASMICIYLMPVSVASSIMMTTTFFTGLLAYWISQEVLSWREISTIICGFAGVLMIVNPSLFNGGGQLHDRVKQDHKQYPYYALGGLFGFIFSFMSAMNFITIR